MRRLILDASVIAKWFSRDAEGYAEIAAKLRRDFVSEELVLLAPPILFLELLNIAGRRWRWTEANLREFADSLQASEFEAAVPSLRAVVPWIARGLSAYDASYVALAEEQGIALITADKQIAEIAPSVASLLSAY